MAQRATVAITHDPAAIGPAIDAALGHVVGARLLGFLPQAVRHLWEAERLGVGEADTTRMRFPALSLDAAVRIFTRRAYGRELTFEHA
jgi:hypothetical protein